MDNETNVTLANILAKPHTDENILLDSLVLTDDNPRDNTRLQLNILIDSYKRYGFSPDKRLIVSLRDDGQRIVCCGNRRTAAAKLLEISDKDTYSIVFPDDSLPCVVYTGLTTQEEMLIRTDHRRANDVLGLNEYELMLECRLLLPIFSQEKIAEHLGYFHLKGKKVGKPNREAIQHYCELAQLPEFVRDEFRKATNDKDASSLRISDIGTLWKARNADIKTAGTDETLVNNARDCKGIEFVKAWTPIANNSRPASAKKSLSPNDATKLADLIGNNSLVAALVKSVTGQVTRPAMEIAGDIVAMEKLISVHSESLAKLNAAKLEANTTKLPVTITLTIMPDASEAKADASEAKADASEAKADASEAKADASEAKADASEAKSKSKRNRETVNARKSK